MLSWGSSCFLLDLHPVSFRSTEVFTYLSYHSLFYHKSFFCHFFLFDVPKPGEHVLLQSHLDILASTCHSVYLFILRRGRISTAFILFSFFCNTHVSLPYNCVGTDTALCTAKRATVLTFRRLINAAKAPCTGNQPCYRQQYAFPHPSRIFHLY